MDNFSAIDAALASIGVKVHGKIFSDPSEEKIIFIPIVVETDELGKKKPSGKVLSQIRTGLAEKGVVARFLAIDANSENAIENGLRTSLISSFPDLIRSSYISSEKRPTVWLEYKAQPSEVEKEGVKNHIGFYFANLGVDNYVISDGESDLPSKMKMLQLIRLSAPVAQRELEAQLLALGYIIPSSEWLNRRFDQLRRSGFLVRKSDGNYVLTMNGLQVLGTLKNRRSPDIFRFLALNRRR
jgi:hypothetical protein